MTQPTTTLREGETCWRIARAERVALLIDGEEYFAALADALENARKSVWLLGWDFHSAVRLRRSEASERPDDLVGLLEALVRERPELHVRVLGWDFAMLYALEREFLPLLQFGAKTHPRIQFEMDSAHPLAASQHQKLVVVDDSVAFVGGFDLTAHRWDTREHLPGDPRRRTPAGNPYAPFHDVQIAVDGEAAAALAELARQRWLHATGRSVEPTPARSDAWPDPLEPAVRDVTVGIARTHPAHRGVPEVREVEALYRASIAAARRWIYVENQYLTAPRIGAWLAERLREADGPELVIVGPRENSGWLEESTMGAMRDHVVRELRDADAHGRLRIVYPHRADLPDGQFVNVHSKVMVVDDDFARVGSSNLSNRSLGLDTECDLAFEARGEARVRDAIAAFRNDLLGEHLGADAERVAAEIERTGSLVAALDALAGGERTLLPIDAEAGDWAAGAMQAVGAIDPEHPVALEELVRRFEQDAAPAPNSRRRALVQIGVVLLVFGGLAFAWQATPLGDWLTGERMGALLGHLRASWHGPLLATLLFTLACVLLVPVTALTVAAGLALGPVLGIAVAWIGATASAMLGYLAGRVLWRDAVRRLAGERLNALSQRLARRGVLSTALVRIVPVAPFMLVNLVAGASHVRARDFAIGSALGLLPGAVLLVVTTDRIRAAFDEPRGAEWLWAALAVLACLGAVAAARRFPWRGGGADAEDG